RSELNGVFGSRTQPFVDLRVPIGEAESTRAVMEGSGSISPGAGVVTDGEEAVVDGIRMLVEREPRTRRIRNLGSLEELAPLLIHPGMAAAIIIPVISGPPKQRIHRVAADPHRPAFLLLWRT